MSLLLQTLPTWTFVDPLFLADPYPTYAGLLAGDPVYKMEVFGGAWVIPRHADVTAQLRDPRLSANRSDALVAQFTPEERAELADFRRLFSRWMLFFDPPQHTRPRRAMHEGFATGIVQSLRPVIASMVNDLLDRAVDRGRLDLIADVAHPLPVDVIAQLVGVPTADRARFVAWSDAIADFFGSGSGTIEMARAAQRSLVELTAYFAEIVADRRIRPQHDLITHLLQLQAGEAPMPDEELYAQCTMLLFAGHETTRNLIGNGMLALLQHPEQCDQLRRSPALIGPAVEEMLRYDSPVQFGTRLAAEDLELHGHTVQRGQILLFLLGAANRDPARFPDPGRFIVTRDPNRHVSFGHGPHMCLGAGLARLETAIAITAILERFPNLRLDGSPLAWRRNFGFRGLESLPVAWS